MTLRSRLIEAAARSMSTRGRTACTSTDLAEWMECSGAAACVGREFGMDRERLQQAVDGWSWSRLLKAVQSRLTMMAADDASWMACRRRRAPP